LVIGVAILLIAATVLAVVHFAPQISARLHKHSAQPVSSPQPASGDSH